MRKLLLWSLILLAACSNTEVSTTVTLPNASPTIAIEVNTPTVTQVLITPTTTPTRETTSTPTATSEWAERTLAIKKTLPGKIYFRTQHYPYTKYVPSLGVRGYYSLKVDNTDDASPDQAISFEFSNYSAQIVYGIFNDDGHLEVWLSDIDLSAPSMLFQDNEDWLGDLDDKNYEYPFILTWGPGDLTILVKSIAIDNRLILYSLTDKNSFGYSGQCNRLVRVIESNKIAIGCDDGSSGSNDLLALLPDGKIERVDLKEIAVLNVAVEWAISPDGESAVYLDKDYTVNLIGPDDQLVEIPMYLDPKADYYYDLFAESAGFRWHPEGSLALVFGNQPNNDSCPQYLSSVTEELHTQPCWYVVDVKTGEFVWWLTPEDIESLGYQWNAISTGYEAEFSPDGKWVAIFVAEGGIEDLLLFSLVDDAIISLGSSVEEKIRWVK